MIKQLVAKIISRLFHRMGYSVVRNGSLRTLAGENLPFSHQFIPRHEHTFSHFMEHGYPDVALGVYDVDCSNDDVLIAERLLKSYHSAIADEKQIPGRPQNDLWQVLQNIVHKDFLDLLGRREPQALAQYLCNMSKLSITHGMTQGTQNYTDLVSSEDSRLRSAAFYADKLVALAEALGCLPCENPESGVWGQNLYTNIDELVAKIEAAIGIDITPPRISGGLYGIASKKGLYHFRDVNSLYTAWRIREILKGTLNPSVCEIGAGTGRTAFYCRRMGINDITIFDLPYVAVVSGYYLIKSFPDARIALYGEPSQGTPPAITISPYWCFAEAPDNRFDLTINQDSFPEIDRRNVLGYLRDMRRNTKQYFLSINQEGRAPQTGPDNPELVVPQVVEELGGGFERVYRFPYWIRQGYVEELYKIIK